MTIPPAPPEAEGAYGVRPRRSRTTEPEADLAPRLGTERGTCCTRALTLGSSQFTDLPPPRSPLSPDLHSGERLKGAEEPTPELHFLVGLHVGSRNTPHPL